MHDDGDEEDLEEEEARAAIEEYQALDAEVLRGLWARRGDKQRAYENKAERNVARRCTAASQAVEALREDLLELEASLLPALSQLEGVEEGGVSSWVSAARGATNKEVAGSKKGAAKKGAAAAPAAAKAEAPPASALSSAGAGAKRLALGAYNHPLSLLLRLGVGLWCVRQAAPKAKAFFGYSHQLAEGFCC